MSDPLSNPGGNANDPAQGSTPRGKGEHRIEPSAEGGYDLAPPDVFRDDPPAAPSSTPGSPGKAKLDAPGLTDDFDDDADFTHDPEVDRALKGDAPDARAATKDEDPADKSVLAFVRPGAVVSVPPKVTGAIGAALVLAGAIAAAVRAEQWAGALLATLYWGLLHTATGIGALGVAAHFNNQRFGRLDLAAARMSICVGALLLAININVPIPRRFDEALLGAGAYFACALLLFRNGLQKTLHLAAAHFTLWAVFYAGLLLHSWATSA